MPVSINPEGSPPWVGTGVLMRKPGLGEAGFLAQGHTVANPTAHPGLSSAEPMHAHQHSISSTSTKLVKEAHIGRETEIQIKLDKARTDAPMRPGNGGRELASKAPGTF